MSLFLFFTWGGFLLKVVVWIWPQICPEKMRSQTLSNHFSEHIVITSHFVTVSDRTPWYLLVWLVFIHCHFGWVSYPLFTILLLVNVDLLCLSPSCSDHVQSVFNYLYVMPYFFPQRSRAVVLIKQRPGSSCSLRCNSSKPCLPSVSDAPPALITNLQIWHVQHSHPSWTNMFVVTHRL